jgi:MT0933-like antitoxin protein
MAGLSGWARKAQQLARNPKVKKALRSRKGQEISGKLLDGAAGAAEKATKGKHTDKIQRARDEARKRLSGGF